MLPLHAGLQICRCATIRQVACTLRLLPYAVALYFQVTELQAKLQAAVQEAEDINNQEKMFGWALTKYALAAFVLCFDGCMQCHERAAKTAAR